MIHLRDIPFPSTVAGSVLDIFAPDDPSGCPVVVVLHGQGGSDRARQNRSLGVALADAGSVVALPPMALESPARMVQDDGRLLRQIAAGVRCAIAATQQVAAEKGADIERTVLFGSSAGGFIGLHISLLDRRFTEQWDRVAPGTRPVFEEAGTSRNIVGFVGFNAAAFVFDVRSGVEPSGLASVVDPRRLVVGGPDVALRFLISAHDPMTPDWHVDEVRRFVGELEAQGRSAEFTILDHPQHFPPTSGPRLTEVVNAVLGVAGG